MSHPLLHRLTDRRMALVGLAAAAVIPAGPAFAQTLADIAPADPVCVTDPVEVPLPVVVEDPCAAAVEDALAGLVPATAPGEVLATEVPPAAAMPIIEAVLSQTSEAISSDEAPAAQPPAPASTGGTDAEPAPSRDVPDKFGAAGSDTTVEVLEPTAPQAEGRIVDGPTLQPANLGVNIPGIRSAGLTLEPYQSPLVSTPMDDVTPQVAAPLVSTATPVQAAAVDALRLTGAALVPFTEGPGVWVTATTVALLASAGILRRRQVVPADGLVLPLPPR